MVDLHVGGDGLIADGDGDVAALGRDDRAPLLAPRGGGGLDERGRFLLPKQHGGSFSQFLFHYSENGTKRQGILAFYRELTEWGATGACYFGENMIFYCDSKEIDFSLQGERL